MGQVNIDADLVGTKLLDLLIEDFIADSGNHEPLDDFLRENFDAGELEVLERIGLRLALRAAKAAGTA